jgi:hypothetical protein
MAVASFTLPLSVDQDHVAVVTLQVSLLPRGVHPRLQRHPAHEPFGLLTWEPLVQSLLALSFKLPESWMGLPFLLCAAGYLPATTSSWMIRLDITSAAGGEEVRYTSDSTHRWVQEALGVEEVTTMTNTARKG